MKIVLHLHFYQPHNQQEDILLRVVEESYRPILKGLKKNKVVVNVTGSLLDLLVEKGFGDVVEDLKNLVARGQVELTGSANYHAFLPLLPEDEIKRQIEINSRISKKHFGSHYKPKGFFSPEMAINDKVLNIVKECGFEWVSCPQVAYKSGLPDTNKIYEDKKSKLKVFFRNKRVSSLILSAVTRDAKELIKETKDLQKKDSFWFCVMDAETFGHHRIGHEKMLIDILNNSFFEPVRVDEIIKDFEIEQIDLRPSTWTNEEQDFWLDLERKKPAVGRSFILWKDPDNPIHKLQWQLTNLVISVLNKYKDKNSSRYKAARKLLDKAISSDQYWWASLKPWWSLEMIEQGAYALKAVLSTLVPKSQDMKKAEKIYKRILDKAFEWQRTGFIRKKHLENSATYLRKPFSKRTPEEWHNQMILEFEDEMKKSAKNLDFEKAIKWRDAILKIKQGNDVHDVLHVVDELWTARTIPSVKPFLKHKWEEFSDFAKSNFKPKLDKRTFEKWKKRV